MRLKNRDLAVVLGIAALNLGWALLPNRPPALNIAGLFFVLPFICLFPGYTLTALLFTQERQFSPSLIRAPRLNIAHPLTLAERLILSFGLSLALDILSGFVLDLLPQGLQAFSWAAFLSLLTTLFALGALYRRSKNRGSHSPRPKTASRRSHLPLSSILLLVLALLIVGISIRYATTTLRQQVEPGFTQLWIQSAAQQDRHCTVAIGVQSYEHASTTYRITMAVNNEQIAAWPAVIVAPQNKWGLSISLPPQKSNSLYVEVRLYRTQQPGTVYREVHITLQNAARGSKQLSPC